MTLSLNSIPFHSIEFIDTWNLHPWDIERCPASLKLSLSQLGVLHPPVVIENDSSFIPLTGFKRLRFIKAVAQSPQDLETLCLVARKDTPSNHILDMILCDQMSASPLSIAEKAQFLMIASRHLPEKELISKYFDRLQLKRKPSTIKLLSNLLKQHETIIDEAHAGRLSENIIESILQLNNPSDRVKLVEFFKNLNLGGGKQKKFYTLIRDISRLKNETISSYLEREEILTILKHKEMNIPQKINHLGKILEQNLAPASSQAQKEFAQQVNSLQLPAQYDITHSPSFEKDEVTLSITFNSFADCKKYLANNIKPKQ